MKKQEQEAWEHFCRTGAVGDYLSYRQSIDFIGKQGADTVTEVRRGAVDSGRGGYSGKAAGGAGPSSYSVDP